MTGAQIPEGLIDAIYDAALGAADWSRVLEEIAQVSGSTTAALYLLDKQTNTVPVIASPRIDPIVLDEFSTHVAAIDERLEFWQRNPHYPIIHDYLHTDESAIERSAYYDWMQRNTGTRYYAAGKVFSDDKFFAPLTILRDASQGAVQQPQLDLLNAILIHLRRALPIHLRFGEIRIFERAAAEALDKADFAVFFVERGGRILHRNRLAAEIIARRDAFSDAMGRLQALRSGDDAILQRGLAAGSAGFTHRFERASGKRAYSVTATPTPSDRSIFASLRVSSLVLVVDPDHEPEIPEAVLRTTFALTPAECRVAIALAGGRSIEAVAKITGTAIPTARLHLQHIFHKTGTKRQAELVALLLKLSAGSR